MRAAIEALLGGHTLSVPIGPDTGPPRALLPGSFNPLHEGHLGLAEAASGCLGVCVAFELAAFNVDKPPLSAQEIQRRAEAFAAHGTLWVTKAATFVEKARLFPGCVFVVGADTAERIVQARFHGGTEEGVRAALAEVRGRGCRFLVAGRLGPGGFVGLESIPVPGDVADLFTALPESVFRRDVSSTGLRGGTLAMP